MPYTVTKELCLSLLCELAERKIAIIRLAFLFFHHTNFMLVLGKMCTMQTNDLQATGISAFSQVYASLIMEI